MRRRDFRNADWSDPKWQENVREYQAQRQRGKRLFGIGVALVGLAWILVIVMHISLEWERVWPYVLILVGLLLGVKHNFSRSPWWVLIVIGAANIVEMYYPNHEELLWASALVLAGIVIAMRPARRPCTPRWKMDKTINNDANLNMDITFGGRKEVVTTKDFKGGVVSATFGGVELNFMQADFTGPTAVLDLRVSFGGVEIIVPSNWDIQNEINPSFGNVEDERSMQTPSSPENRKTLILRGNCSFGSVEIKSY